MPTTSKTAVHIFQPKTSFIMLMKLLFSLVFLTNFTFHCQTPELSIRSTPTEPSSVTTTTAEKGKIQVALLLDTSNSMDGLIDQAKAQLWKMVNRLADAQRQNEGITLEIALYEYGNQGLSKEKGYIRQVQPLGTDLDGLSEKLFQLRTNGGDEFCGWVIQDAVGQLPWSAEDKDLKIIVIAGNEPFTQGPVDFRQSCGAAVGKNIIINTIHCGDFATGVSTQWQEGATIGKGKYMIIDTDKKITHVSTPYDSRVVELNSKLNDTYVGYGRTGEAKKDRQVAQDKNAAEYGSANVAQRAAAKSKGSYRNADWDIVDAADEKADFVATVKDEDLPANLKGKSKAELQQEINRLREERIAVKKELAELEKKMALYVAEEMKKSGTTEETLDNVLIQAVVEQAKAKGFEFK
jgi:hypothetical protein